MKQSNGYIYVRNHPSYHADNACKLGKTFNILERDTLYATSEITRGQFEAVFEVAIDHTNAIERLLQNEFREWHIYRDAGTEFYHRTIIPRIEPCLTARGITYRKLSDLEIGELVRTVRDREPSYRPLPLSKFKKTGRRSTTSYTPRNDQTDIVEKAVAHFQQRDKGVLVLMCGVGKTLISLWIAQKLNTGSVRILVGVPNLLLLKQWEEVICALFRSVPYAVVSGGVDEDQLARFLEQSREQCIVITTYSSAYKVFRATDRVRFTFQMKLLDEVHHLTSTNMRLSHTTKKYIQMLDIPSEKQLSLTATLKLLEGGGSDDVIVSNDNVNYFGDIIHRKCLLEAIMQNIVCDYAIQTIIANEEKLEQQLMRFRITEENDKRLFLSAFASLKSISDGHSHHLLIYSNNKDNSLKLARYLKMLLGDNYFDIPGFYYSNYHSEMKRANQQEILSKFKAAPSGIITCVYCLGEGWDFPLLDGVVFAENMSSNIRIVQSALRASRKNKDDAEKRTKIILPILNRDDWLEDGENPDLKKVREVIYHMGLEDETIAQKIKVFRLDVEQAPRPTSTKEGCKNGVEDFDEYDEELTQRLRLKTVKRASLATTYERARKIIADKHVQSKGAYYELCDKDNRLPRDPETVFKGKFTNWIDYLGIERIYCDLDTCKKKVAEYLRLYPEIRAHYLDLSSMCKKLCEVDSEFPPNGLWAEYFDVNDLRDIITVENKKKRLGVAM